MTDRKTYFLNDIELKDPYCVNAFEKECAYLLSLDADRLLAGFYENAGLVTAKMRYPGWEDSLIGGHTLGHYLTACAQGCVNGQAKTEIKDALYARVTYLCDKLLLCQQQASPQNGFLFGAVLLDKTNPELCFDNVEKGLADIHTQAWVPWYTMHKILDGLICAYRLTGYENALLTADRLGDWVYQRTSRWTKETQDIVLSIEYGGMNDALYKLYQCTQKETHLSAAHAFDEIPLFEKVASMEKNVLDGLHANTTIPKFLGALNRYLTLGESEARYLHYAKCFWEMVTDRHSYVTGGNSEWEHFGADYILDKERTSCNNETCNTYNMLKLSRRLFQITGEKKYADYYENTFLNAILSSQNPESGMSMYFQPMASGYFKTYGRPYDQFWCCIGSGMENFTKLGESIYFHTDDSIFVNLYISSVLTDKERGLTLQQKADFLHDDTISLHLSRQKASKPFSLLLRIPDWSFGHEVRIQGKEENPPQKDGYLVLDQSREEECDIEIRFERRITAHGLLDCANVFAFKYGQILLSADLGTEAMTTTTTGVDVTIPERAITGGERLSVAGSDVPSFLREVDTHFEKNPEQMEFRLKDTDRPLLFKPHFLTHQNRYGIYWYFY